MGEAFCGTVFHRLKEARWPSLYSPLREERCAGQHFNTTWRLPWSPQILGILCSSTLREPASGWLSGASRQRMRSLRRAIPTNR